MHISWEMAHPLRRWTAHKFWNKCERKALKFPEWAEGGTSPSLFAATGPANRSSAECSLAGYRPFSKLISATTYPANGWKTPSAIRWIMWIHRDRVMRPFSPSCPKSCSSKHCDGTSLCCLRRSEERRVGKEWRSRWSADHLKKQ